MSPTDPETVRLAEIKQASARDSLRHARLMAAGFAVLVVILAGIFMARQAIDQDAKTDRAKVAACSTIEDADKRARCITAA